MKRSLLYLFALGVAGVSADAFAQRAQPGEMVERQLPFFVTENGAANQNEAAWTPKPMMQSLRDLTEDILYEDDFSDFSLWIPESNGQGEWELVTEAPDPMELYIGAVSTTTVDNGFAAFNGIQYLLAGAVDPQDATLTYNGSFDFTNQTDVAFSFEQQYRRFVGDVVSFELSVDDGETWVSFQVNEDMPVNPPSGVGNVIVKDVSAVAANQPDVLLRFRWVNPSDNNSQGSGYGWAIDDMAFITPPANYIALTNAWYDEWHTFNNPDLFNGLFGQDIDMVDSYEYSVYGKDAVRPLTFTGEVRNLGTQPQTNVTFTVTVTDPDGTPYEFSETLETLPPGETAIMKIVDAMLPPFYLDDSETDAVFGLYIVSFSVDQDEEDFFPEDNVANDKGFRVNEEYIGHNRNANFNYFTTLAGAGYEAFSRYSFYESIEVDYIEFALTTAGVNPEDALFESIDLDLFTGSVYAEQDAPNDVFDSFFFDEEGNGSLSYFITDAEIFNAVPSPAAETNWVRVMFPEPITVNPGLIYNASIVVGAAPDIGSEDFIWPLTQGANPVTSSHYFGPFDGDPEVSLFIGNTAFAIRLGSTSSTINTSNSEPVTFLLGQNYPNPTNGNETLIDWELLEPAENITFTVHDMNGRMVDQRDFGDRPAGKQETIRLNSNLAAGVYQYSLVVGNYRAVRKMVVTK